MNRLAPKPKNVNIWKLVSDGIIDIDDVSSNGNIMSHVDLNLYQNNDSQISNRNLRRQNSNHTSNIVRNLHISERDLQVSENLPVSKNLRVSENLQIIEKNDEITNNNCVICMSREKKYAVTPCFHFCLCEICCNKINNKCPICRKINIGLERIYN